MPASWQNACASDDSCTTPYLHAASGLTSLHTSHACKNEVPTLGGEHMAMRFSGCQNRVKPSAGSSVTRPCIDAQAAGAAAPQAKNPTE